MSAALPLAVRLIALDSVGSTNDEAKRLAVSGAAEGAVVTAREQTQGRGRRGRAWTSPPGNLYLSLLLRPDVAMARLPELGFLAAVALTDALALLVPAPGRLGHKWPNDVLLGGKKLAGILVETATGADPARAAWAVIGLGINVMHHPSDADRPATSLAAEGASIEAAALLPPLVVRLLAWRERWLAEGFAPLRAAWLARAARLGETISLRGPAGAESGVFAGLDEAGALLLDGASGVKRVPVAEVIGAAA
ncbi:MAG: biotin--[acetyl-CoA-carboxylase] ligase [Alphaproteobacteria bacterium]|nr:biotin--[acetyl-CoA-carboxylase] ligase [Alphaproteobacteria bacterium]